MHPQRHFFLLEKNRVRGKQISIYCLCCLKKADSAKTLAVMHILASVISNRFQISKNDLKITCQQTKGVKGNANREQVSFMYSRNAQKKICKMLIREPSIFHLLFITVIKFLISFRDLGKEN